MQKDLSTAKNLFMFSPAKLNLGLRLVERRPDGYHLLESLFWPIDFGDEIELSAHPAQRVNPYPFVHYEWAESAPFKNTQLFQNEETLVGQLLKGLKSHRGFHAAPINIRKVIPIGAGLGGISSNVGTILKSLVMNQALSIQEAHQVAVDLGADIPFFLNPVPSWVSGVGDIINPVSLQKCASQTYFFIIFLFPFPISTPSIFQEFRSTFGKLPLQATHHGFGMAKSFDELCTFIRSSKNDLEFIATRRNPEMSELLSLLRKTDALYSGLSGTGPTCFAVFDDIEKRNKTAQDLLKKIRNLSCKSVFARTFLAT